MSTVRIIYKSGAEVTVECENFVVQHNTFGGLVGIKWESAEPAPLHAGIDDIAAVWRVA